MEKFALITGSSSGLGLQIAGHLLDEGYVVLGASRRGTDIIHGRFIDIIADIRSESSVEELFEVVRQTTNGINLLVSNAGICTMSQIGETSSKEFVNHLNTNILGTFHLFKHFCEFIIEDDTHIIQILSLASKKGMAGSSAYCASQFGLRGLYEACLEEWKDLGIRGTTIVPGPIETPLWEDLDISVSREKMMDVDDFIHVFDMVIKGNQNIHFPEIVFSDRNIIIS